MIDQIVLYLACIGLKGFKYLKGYQVFKIM